MAKLPVDGEGVASRPLEISRGRVSTRLSRAREPGTCLPSRARVAGRGPGAAREACRVRRLLQAVTAPREGKPARIPSRCDPGPPHPRGRFPERSPQTRPAVRRRPPPRKPRAPGWSQPLLCAPCRQPTCGGTWGREGWLPLNRGGVYITVIHWIWGEEFPLNCHRETAYFRCTVRIGLFAQKLKLALKCWRGATSNRTLFEN